MFAFWKIFNACLTGKNFVDELYRFHDLIELRLKISLQELNDEENDQWKEKGQFLLYTFIKQLYGSAVGDQ